jgi:hypothetical protein
MINAHRLLAGDHLVLHPLSFWIARTPSTRKDLHCGATHTKLWADKRFWNEFGFPPEFLDDLELSETAAPLKPSEIAMSAPSPLRWLATASSAVAAGSVFFICLPEPFGREVFRSAYHQRSSPGTPS